MFYKLALVQNGKCRVTMSRRLHGSVPSWRQIHPIERTLLTPHFPSCLTAQEVQSGVGLDLPR
jgi:hypothetical protein